MKPQEEILKNYKLFITNTRKLKKIIEIITFNIEEGKKKFALVKKKEGQRQNSLFHFAILRIHPCPPPSYDLKWEEVKLVQILIQVYNI